MHIASHSHSLSLGNLRPNNRRVPHSSRSSHRVPVLVRHNMSHTMKAHDSRLPLNTSSSGTLSVGATATILSIHSPRQPTSLLRFRHIPQAVRLKATETAISCRKYLEHQAPPAIRTTLCRLMNGHISTSLQGISQALLPL